MKFSQKILLFLFALVLPEHSAPAQYHQLEDKDAVRMTRAAIDSTYNLNFDAAEKIIIQLEKRIKDYPGVLLLKAFYMTWKYKPIKKEQQVFTDFEKLMSRSITVCDSILELEEKDPEATFFKLTSHAYLAQLYADNGMSMKALGQAKDAYTYMKAGFDLVDRNPEFYFPCGLYNYYRERYPEENPFYKSFVWFFKSGDMEEGINMLKKGVDQGLFDNVECITYLFHIYLRYEDKPYSSIYYANLLKERYPNNLSFTANYIENSIRINTYAALDPLIRKLQGSKSNYYQYLGEIYAGYSAEMAEKNYAKAILHYSRADSLGNIENVRVPHHDSILYFGMGRTYKKMGQQDQAQDCLKKSVKNAEYRAYRIPAEDLLKK